MKSAMASKSLNHFRWIDQLYFCPSPRKARRAARKNPRAYASWATTLAKVALSHRLATQVRLTRAGGQAGSAAAGVLPTDMPMSSTPAAAGGALDRGMSADAAAGQPPPRA